jgi:hypothetical protein
MSLPIQLSDWTLDLVRKVSDNSEPGWFDFKAVLTASEPKDRDKHAENIRKLSCAMANTDGGYIIFGVIDAGNRKPGEDPIPGLPATALTTFRKEYGDLVQNIRRPLRFECSPTPILVGSEGRAAVTGFVKTYGLGPLGPVKCSSDSRSL